MPPSLDADGLKAKLEEGKRVRLEGNEALKAGEFTKALQNYHTVLATLRGLESTASTLYPAAPSPIHEKKDEDGMEPKKEEVTKTTKDEIKEQITLTYLNMSIVHLRKLPPNGKRALESALDALKLEPDNTKAKFREAQARIQCGETNKGKKMLEELYKKSPDVAIQTELKKLAEREKESQKKANAQFAGMYTKKKPASSTTNTSSSVKITETTGDEPAPEAAPTNGDKVADPVTGAT